ncbi:hypothetical protein BHC44_11510 [Snodgrassella alvi]|uniref:ABC-three component systems C-terminal domain-containing protein n=1 Tax=Snodgrassella alvi TaxID=1196083 RepID=A0A2N9XUA9_9NEIS|nr:ABC-three component system protein [Snodgrassella alvi]PIT51166.1 hypothetical protein BHC44_11510 [Snodgrassella alvi]PIT52951.1 hypothetical protein BHC49_11845 [Snodgrassella alvi]
MDTVKIELNKSSAGAQGLGFDYQFYYFIYLALQLKEGEKIGYESIEDVHLETNENTKILIQLKHSIQTDKTGGIVTMSNRDPILWETLSRWVGYIKKLDDFLTIHSFRFITNKTENNNEFIKIHKQFIFDKNLSLFKKQLVELLNKTRGNESRKHIDIVLNLDEKNLSEFLLKLDIQLDVGDIEQKIKNFINNNWPVPEKDLDKIYSQLFTKLSHSKYDGIRKCQNFVMTFDEIKLLKVNVCKDVYGNVSLPIRNFINELPENLEEQMFIRQLNEIGELGYGEKKSRRITKYTTFMLNAMNNIAWWLKDNYVTTEQIEKFESTCVERWERIFDDQYREIERAIYNNEANIDELEKNICNQAIGVVRGIRELDLKIDGFQNTIGIEINNGFFYSLSNRLEIGWHYEWEKKYKTQY